MNEITLVKLQATKSNTPPWVFFTFLKIVQMIPNRAKHHICIESQIKFNPIRRRTKISCFQYGGLQNQKKFR